MGFFSSLKSQLGRDTGRFISNKIFGNRHATKYQRVGGTGRSLFGNSSSEEKSSTLQLKETLRLEQKKAKLESQKLKEKWRLEREKAEMESERKEEEYQRLIERENLLKLEKSIEKLISMKIPSQKQPLIDIAKFL